VCVFVRLRIYPPRIKLAESNFARRFIGVRGKESHILENFTPPEAQNRTNRPARVFGGQRVVVVSVVEVVRYNRAACRCMDRHCGMWI